MKARLLKDGRIVNPLYNRKEERRARNTGETYPHPPQVDVSAGYVLSDPDCWVHCCPGYLNSTPIAEPADAECSDAVAMFMQKTRPQLLQRVRSLYQNVTTIKDADLRKHIERQARAYGIAPGTTDPHAPEQEPANSSPTDESELSTDESEDFDRTLNELDEPDAA